MKFKNPDEAPSTSKMTYGERKVTMICRKVKNKAKKADEEDGDTSLSCTLNDLEDRGVITPK